MSEYRLVMKGVVKTFPGVKALDLPRWVSDVRYEFVCDGKTFDHLFVKLQMGISLSRVRSLSEIIRVT